MDDRAQAAPVLIFLIIAIGIGWQFVYADAELPSFEPEGKLSDPNNSSEDTFGFLGQIGGFFSAIWDAITLFASLLTFDLVEGPAKGPGAAVWDFVKWGWRVLVGGSLLWAIAALIAP